MRKFIISDLHGNGEVYDSVMGYLDNISMTEGVELYINGDLIDKGIDSFAMLEDVIKRVKGSSKVKIKYLGGNHELMMWKALKDKEQSRSWCKWMCNGGWVVDEELYKVDNVENKKKELIKFLGNLDLYHNFYETINKKRILLVHAQAPKIVKDTCDMKLSDNTKAVEKAVWNRKEMNSEKEVFLGKEGYLTIVGHTPVDTYQGFYYDKNENYLNIDSGCASFANGFFSHKFVPLVEVCDGILKIVLFNHNNEIVNGFIFDGNIYNMGMLELNKNRELIDHKYDNCLEEKKKLIIKKQGLI